MKFIARKITSFGDFYPPECEHLAVLIQLTDEEVKILQDEADTREKDDLEYQLFETAGATPAYYGGPGHSYVSEPTYRVRYHTARIFQQRGMDI